MAHILSSEIGQAVARHVSDDRERSRRLRAIGLWSLTSVTRNLVTLVDYVSGVRGWSHFYASPWMLESQPYLSYGTSSLVDEDRK